MFDGRQSLTFCSLQKRRASVKSPQDKEPDLPRTPAQLFHRWLIDQKHRKDEVGRLAIEVVKDKTFPRHLRKLHLFLHYYSSEPENYEAVKLAHREWRELRARMRNALENPGNAA